MSEGKPVNAWIGIIQKLRNNKGAEVAIQKNELLQLPSINFVSLIRKVKWFEFELVFSFYAFLILIVVYNKQIYASSLRFWSYILSNVRLTLWGCDSVPNQAVYDLYLDSEVILLANLGKEFNRGHKTILSRHV